MKKVISIVLALLMMVPMAAMLIPTASAADVAPQAETESWIYYEQNFNDASLASKMDAELANALGWSAPGNDSTIMIKDGQLRAVNHYSSGGKGTANAWAGTYEPQLTQKDARMMSSTTVIEYTMTYQRRAKGSESIKVSDTKSIVADGQGVYQFAATKFWGSNANNGYILSRVNLGGYISPKNTFRIPNSTWTADCIEVVNDIAYNDVTKGIEYENQFWSLGASEGTYTSDVIGKPLKIKQIFDPAAGTLELYVNEVLTYRTTKAYEDNLRAWAAGSETGYVNLAINNGIDVLFDDIKIWGYRENIDMTPGTTGKIYYEQDFNDEKLKDLEDKDLAEALGWMAPDSRATMWMEDGKVRIFTQYTPSGVYPATANQWSGGYSAGVLAHDDNILRNTTVVEYKFTYNRRAAGAENNKTVYVDGKPKTVIADGQGTFQTAEFFFHDDTVGSAAKNAGYDNTIVRINQRGDGWLNTMKGVDSATDNKVWDKKTTFTKVVDMPAGETYELEMHNCPVISDEPNESRISNIMNREYSVKVIIEPWSHRLYAFVDGQLFITMNVPENTANYVINDWGRLITDQIGFYVKPGVDVTVDDIKIYEYVPNLTISEIMVNGTKAGANGKYQWIEITNPSAAPVNVYDYAIHLDNTPESYELKYVIGDELEQGGQAWFKDDASTLGYFSPGAKTLSNGQVFNSPAYEGGVLQPGESAIVLFPQTAIDGGKDVTDEVFNAYLKGIGMPDGTKTFVADNNSNYAFCLGTEANESTLVQIVKATNTATDGGYKPVANCKNQPVKYAPAFAECTAWVTAKGNTAGTKFWGLTVTNSYPATGLGGNMALNTDSSFEISYSGWVNTYAQQAVDFDHTNLKWGFTKVNAGVARKGIAGNDVYTTPGYLPAEARRVATVNVNTEDEARVVNTHTGFTISTPEKKGYETQIWVNGVLLKGVEIGKVTTTLSVAHSADIEVKYYRDETVPYFCGYQLSEVDEENGTYDIRLLAAINDVEALNEKGINLGFDVLVLGDADKMIAYEVGYVYEKVSVYENGDATLKTAAELGYDFEYMFALHIKNVPVDGSYEFLVKAISDFDVENYEFNDQGYTYFVPKVQ